VNKPLAEMPAPASSAVLQNHIWPLLRAQQSITEEHLQIEDHAGCPVPVFANAQRGQFDGTDCFYWVFFVAQELSRFEAKLLDARQRAEDAALELPRRGRFISAITDAMPVWSRTGTRICAVSSPTRPISNGSENRRKRCLASACASFWGNACLP
jgi:hypothetical protein